MNTNQHVFTEFVEPATGRTLDTASSPITATSDPERAARLQLEMEEAMSASASIREDVEDPCGCLPRRKAA